MEFMICTPQLFRKVVCEKPALVIGDGTSIGKAKTRPTTDPSSLLSRRSLLRSSEGRGSARCDVTYSAQVLNKPLGQCCFQRPFPDFVSESARPNARCRHACKLRHAVQCMLHGNKTNCDDRSRDIGHSPGRWAWRRQVADPRNSMNIERVVTCES